MTSNDPTTIAEQIECLARLTGAPDTFVSQVKELFGRKGISLEDDASPYLKALEEAFRREENIRFSALRARQSMAAIDQDFRKMGRAYVEQVTKKHPAAPGDGRRSRYALSRPRGTPITIQGDHRTLVTRTEYEELPLVPGSDAMN